MSFFVQILELKNYLLHFYLLFCLLFLGRLSAYAQEYSLGLKGGLNYSLNKKAAEIVGSAGSFTTNSRIGYQAGIFFQLDVNKFYFRPEVFYNVAEGEYPFPNQPSIYSIEKISIPFLVGYKIYEPLSIFAGPAYQNFLSTTLENVRWDVENQQSHLAGQFGIMYEFERLQIDLRYDFTFSSEENQRIDIPGLMSEAYFDDGRLNKLMLSLSYRLFNSQTLKMPRLRRQRSCYF